MIISDETREKIIQNLNKKDYSFHYKEKMISETFRNRIKNRNKFAYIFLAISLILFFLGQREIFGINHLHIVYFIVFLVALKTVQIWMEYIFARNEIIAEYIKNKEICEITEDDLLLELYSLDDMESEE